MNVHNGETQLFKMRVADKCRNDPTKRKILESVRLQNVPVELGFIFYEREEGKQ